MSSEILRDFNTKISSKSSVKFILLSVIAVLVFSLVPLSEAFTPIHNLKLVGQDTRVGGEVSLYLDFGGTNFDYTTGQPLPILNEGFIKIFDSFNRVIASFQSTFVQ